MQEKRSLYADIGLVLVAIIWGSGFVVTKNTLDNISPYYLIFFRFFISSILTSIIFFKKIKKISKKDIKSGIIIGMFLFLGFGTQTVGLQYTEAGKQAFITATNVVMVPFIYWILSKKSPDKFDITSAFLCIIGIGILSLNNDFTIGYGEFLTFLCAIMFAFQISLTGYFAKDVDPYVLCIVEFLTVSVLSFIASIVLEGPISSINTNTLIPILYLAVFSTMIAFMIQTVAQKYTKSTHTAIILSLEAVFGCIFAIIFLKEEFTMKILIGCFAILISIITSETKWSFLKKEKNKVDY